jgi:hypothetical protein
MFYIIGPDPQEGSGLGEVGAMLSLGAESSLFLLLVRGMKIIHYCMKTILLDSL